ncbi:hypothetical protein FB451DRAFT_1364718 [Mycena latifolia]|nr:hypothetical protein FB451DRAFT_1364718 [Mycena latifolia]
MSVLQPPRYEHAFSGPLPVNLPPVAPLNVPRRSTLPAFSAKASNTTELALSRVASSSWATRRPITAPPITIEVGSSARPKIRPLPPIPPTPKSAPPPRRQTSQASLRPLPSVPEVPPVSVSVTPASPLAPPTPLVQSSAHLSPPFVLPAPPRRFASLSLRLHTSPDALERRALAPPLPSPPPTPGVPEPPSPATAQRKRMSKLRRHLGESVQLELFPDPGDKANVFGETKGTDLYSQTVVAVRKLLELDGDGSDDTSSDEDEDEDDYSLVLITQGQTRQNRPPQTTFAQMDPRKGRGATYSCSATHWSGPHVIATVHLLTYLSAVLDRGHNGDREMVFPEMGKMNDRVIVTYSELEPGEIESAIDVSECYILRSWRMCGSSEGTGLGNAADERIGQPHKIQVRCIESKRREFPANSVAMLDETSTPWTYKANLLRNTAKGLEYSRTLRTAAIIS